MLIITCKNLKKKLATIGAIAIVCCALCFGMPKIHAALSENREEDYRELGDPIRADKDSTRAVWFQIMLEE